jgi:UDP-N-acetylglucosamine 1-carboxyvinyltransferase
VLWILAIRRAAAVRSIPERRWNGGRQRIPRTQEPLAGEIPDDGMIDGGAAYYVIEGGIPLHGEVQLSGAKNAATKLLVATLLTEDACTIRNVPRNLGDVSIIEAVLSALGARIDWVTDDVACIQTANVTNSVVPLELGRKNRLAVLASGPLLHRIGHAVIPAPGGDRIGPRPINFHLDGLQRMGATLEARDGLYHFRAEGLRGATVELPFPSVMATETLIIAATLAQGVTIIENAAIEPEIIDLIKFLQKMGAIIEQRVDRKIVIEGVQRLHGAEHRVLCDRNEAVSLAIAAYLTKGDIRVIGADQGVLLTFLNTLYRVGLDFRIEDDAIHFISGDEPPKAIALETDVHPGFMTDWQQPFTVLLTQASGMSVIHETLYEDRFGYTYDLNRMGAATGVFTKCLGELECRFRERSQPHSCVIRGPTPLHADNLVMPDIRAGASYILAALCASGSSTVQGIEHIERGYDRLDEKLRSLGAHIERRDGEQAD